MSKRLPLLFLALWLTGLPEAAGRSSALASDAAPRTPSLEERVLAGGPEDFMTLRHLVLRGSQRWIGRRLAEIARERHGWSSPPPAEENAAAIAKRYAYFRENSPTFLQRAAGVADALGLDLETPGIDLSQLSYGTLRGGCTVVYYPPNTTALGIGIVSRNYDFSTGDFRGRQPAEGLDPVTSAPYLLELHPEEGYASLAMCAYDLLGGVIDGINSEGLTVALLADDEVLQRFGPQPAQGIVPGFGVLQVGRHLLDTCANVEEAKQALASSELFYSSIPCHYLVADRHGESFIWENEVSMDSGHVIEGDGEVQVSTNFMHHLHFDDEVLPRDGRLGSFTRYRTILERVERAGGPLDLEFVRSTGACVAANLGRPTATQAPGRTLWHSLYFPEERRMQLEVYLGEGPGGGASAIRRSNWIEVSLTD